MPFAKKKVKDLLWCLLIIAAGIAFLYFVVIPSDKSPDSAAVAASSAPTEALEMPDEMQALLDSGSVEWMVGMWAQLTNCTKCQESIAPQIESYLNTKGTVYAEVTVQNGLDLIQQFYLMVFADGVPIEFKLDGDTYQSYPFELSEAVKFNIEFTPEFTLNLGRLDFLLFYDGNPKSDFHMSSHTVWVEQNDEARIPTALQDTVSQRGGLVDSYSGGSYGAWLWKGETLPPEASNIGPREIELKDGEPLLFEAIASRPGVYRTVLIFDGQPVSMIDWESSGSDMLQLPIELLGLSDKGGSFFSVTIPLEQNAIAVSAVASSKILVVRFQEGE